MMFLIFPYPESLRLVELATGGGQRTRRSGTSTRCPFSREIGNIMCGCYLNALAAFVHKKIMHSVPQVSHDMLGAVMIRCSWTSAWNPNYALVLETAFTLARTSARVFSFFVPTADSLRDNF